MATPDKNAWKQSANAPASAGKPASWKPAGPAPGPVAPSWLASRWTQASLVVLGLLSVAGALLAVLLWPRPDPAPALVLVDAGYETNLGVPHNAPGRQAVRALAAWAAAHGEQETRGDIRKVDVKQASLEAGGEAAIKAIEALRGGWNAKAARKVVVFVSAHGVGVPDADGVLVPCLVPEGHDPSKPDGLFKLEGIIEALGRLPSDTHKLLLLDACGIPASWSLGQFQPLFAAALEGDRFQELVKKVPNLAVIASAGKAQPAWASPELRLSAFAHYVLEGLRGAADKDRDDVVDGLELFDYVSAGVEQWARHNRDRAQVPALYPIKEAGRERAKRMTLANHEGHKPTPLPAADEAIEKELDALAKAWAQSKALEAGAPWSHAPHLWRRYQDVLVRAEELARAGDPRSSSDLRAEADKLARRIEESQAVPLASSRLCVPQAEALGFVPSPSDKEWVDKFASTLKSDVAAAEKLAAGLEKEGRDRAEKTWLRLAAWREALRRIAADPAKLVACKALLGALEDASDPRRPAEGHFLAMLAAPGAPPVGDDPARLPFVGRALLLRLQAEDAAIAGGEAVLPWVRPLVDAGDKARRMGQDLLFTTLPEKWAEAGALFDDAARRYAEAQDTATQVRDAMRECHAALAWLPFASRWVAEQRTEDDARRAAALWARVHELHKALRAGEDARKLAKLREVVAGGMDWLRGESERDRSSLAELGDKQDDWHRAEASLRLPGGDPAARRKLASDAARVSRQLHEDSRKAGKAGGAEGAADRVRAEAARHTRLALASIGDPELKTEDGSRLAARLAAFADRAQELAAAAALAPLKEAGESLSQGTAAARQAEGWEVGTHLERDPAQALRQVQVHDLLCWQAERAFLDHWASPPGEGERPYWRAAAAAFLADARLRAETGAEGDAAKDGKRLAAIKVIETRMAAATPLVLEWSASRRAGDFAAGDGAFHLTDEPVAERFYRLKGPVGIDGATVRWLASGQGLQPAEPGVRPWELGKAHLAAIRPDADLYDRRKRKSSFAVHAWFRGQRASSAMAVTIHREPDHLAVEPPLPPTANLAILTDNLQFEKHVASKSALCIVLDCSGSMNYDLPDGKETRIQAAKRVLGEVMQQMPNGVRVSLVAMGAKGFENKAADDPTRTGGVKVVWEEHRWKSSDFKERMRAVNDLEASSYTPLMRALKTARDLLPESCRKRRSIVAITDGGDFNFYRKPSPDNDLKKRGKLNTIRAFLDDTFQTPYDDIGVKVIGFALKVADMKNWEKQAHLELLPALDAIKGEYFDARDAKTLTALLMRNLLRLDYRVDAEHAVGGAEKAPPVGTISRVDRENDSRDNLRWLRIPRSEHKLYVPLLPGVQQRIRARPGDALVLELLPRAESMAFRRWMFARSLARSSGYTPRLAEPVDRWTLAALENFQAGTGGRLRAMATLEQDAGVADASAHLQMIRPSWAWMELVQAKDTKPGGPLRVVSLPNYPAPAYGMEAPYWRTEEPSALKAWWLAGTPPLAGKLADLRERTLADLREEKLDMERAADEATIESVVYEKKCRVPWTQEDNVDVVVHDCMVVRLRHPVGKGPYFVQPDDGDWPGGQAHRFFHEAGKTTGVFWPVRPEQMAKFKQLRIYSVAQLKAKALSRRLELGTPGAGNVRPRPVEE